ncbi:MAG: hypothetical protein HPY89_02105 [Pelotomaculum sp.]|uniref:Uncharacterized protein n=1 Tax=Pelotomaculum thermopropionicum (strain DSM 13744 / JCM 10971 / SI) TaxID=370438 RepID=A5D045_PELTS|nr:hypothetical protein [Pelotomaculum sp.]BAF60389.1 hypothetical protein PTH_2208 [Pelotomaculum thermopropionicum SI]
MFTVLGKFIGKKAGEPEQKEVKCTCGRAAMSIPGAKTNIYLCKTCNKLIYYVDPALLEPKVLPLSLGWLKKRK